MDKQNGSPNYRYVTNSVKIVNNQWGGVPGIIFFSPTELSYRRVTALLFIPAAQNHFTSTTVNPFKLAALKVDDFICRIIFSAFTLANSNHTITTQYTLPIKFGIVSIFVPFNFAVLFSSWNSQNRGHRNIRSKVLQHVKSQGLGNWATMITTDIAPATRRKEGIEAIYVVSLNLFNTFKCYRTPGGQKSNTHRAV